MIIVMPHQYWHLDGPRPHPAVLLPSLCLQGRGVLGGLAQGVDAVPQGVVTVDGQLRPVGALEPQPQQVPLVVNALQGRRGAGSRHHREGTKRTSCDCHACTAGAGHARACSLASSGAALVSPRSWCPRPTPRPTATHLVVFVLCPGVQVGPVVQQLDIAHLHGAHGGWVGGRMAA